MFGMASRTYQRRTQRLRESQTERVARYERPLFDFIAARSVVTREEVLTRFHRVDEALVRGVLHDLTERVLLSLGDRRPHGPRNRQRR